jgi:WbqC-like protein family
MKKLAIMQPYLFPYIGYFQLINAADKFVVYDDVTFIKQGWINRNNILLNGSPFLFTIPIKNISSYSLICETEVSYKVDWKSKLLKTIQQSYRKSPYFEIVFPIIENTFTTQECYISKIAVKSINEIVRYLGLSTEVQESSNSYLNNELSSQERIIDICKQESASQYINPIGGKYLYSKDVFKENGIQLGFIQSQPIQYKQFKDKFVSSLSILDVIMFNSPDEVNIMLQKYELI